MIRLLLLVTLSSLVTLCSYAHAHVMVKQHASLRFLPKGAYFLASYPVSAFKGFDDNHDDLMNQQELQKHHNTLLAQVRAHVQLTEDGVMKELEGLLINLSHTHHPHDSVTHVLVMGRFKPVAQGLVVFHSKLFGKKPSEQKFMIRITWHQKLSNLILTPQKTSITLSRLPSAQSVTSKPQDDTQNPTVNLKASPPKSHNSKSHPPKSHNSKSHISKSHKH